MTLLLGIDIGGTKSAAVIGDTDGNVLARASALTPAESWQEAYAALLGLVQEVCQSHGTPHSKVAAVGVSCGGPLDSRTGIVHAPPNLPKWVDVPLQSLLEADLGLPVHVENDANATAVAEHRWGAGQGCRDMAFLTMGTGIGAGLILDGLLYRGRRDLAGEIGHATIYPGGVPCLCGKCGCLEAMASGTSIGRMGRERFVEDTLTAHDVCARARLGDPIAQSVIADASLAMGIGLANLLQTLNLERIVLGTLAVHAADLFMEPIRASAEAYCWPRVWEGVTIVPAALGDAAQDKAALAAALL
jgi:glucokinase